MDLNCQQVSDKLIDILNEESATGDIDIEMHLLECSDCQAEYERLVHTMMLLRGLPEPLPPPDLVAKIRNQIEKLTKKKTPLFDMLSLIFSKIFVAFKLGPRPVYLNYAALIFYLALTIFLVKLTFLTPERNVQPPMQPIATFSEPVDYTPASHVPTSDSQRLIGVFGDLKRVMLDPSKTPPVFKRIDPKALHHPDGESKRNLSGGGWDDF